MKETYPELADIPIFRKHVHGQCGLRGFEIQSSFQILESFGADFPFAVKLLESGERMA